MNSYVCSNPFKPHDYYTCERLCFTLTEAFTRYTVRLADIFEREYLL